MKKINDVNYLIRLTGRRKRILDKVYVSQIKRFFFRNEPASKPRVPKKLTEPGESHLLADAAQPKKQDTSKMIAAELQRRFDPRSTWPSHSLRPIRDRSGRAATKNFQSETGVAEPQNIASPRLEQPSCTLRKTPYALRNRDVERKSK